jgi:hypothetical protein
MEFKMESREILYEKIQNKKKEWESQLKHLESKVAGFDFDTRVRIQEQIKYLNGKFREIEKKTNEMRLESGEIQQDIGDKVVRSWMELLKKVDEAMSKLKK